jgi:hypothetical protein
MPVTRFSIRQWGEDGRVGCVLRAASYKYRLDIWTGCDANCSFFEIHQLACKIKDPQDGQDGGKTQVVKRVITIPIP